MATSHQNDDAGIPPMMAAMASATGQAGSVAVLADIERAEMATLCAACPRTDACRQWLVTHAGTGPASAPDLCPNHERFRSLAGGIGLA